MARRLILAALILSSCGKPEEPPPPAPSPPPRATKPPPPPPPPAPREKTLDERIDELAGRQKSMTGQYRSTHRLWSELLGAAAGTRHEASIREQLESIESAANRAYRDAYRPLQEEARRLPPRDALAKLRSWSVPPELDIDGSRAAEHQREVRALEDAAAIDGIRSAYDPATEPEPLLARFLASPHVGVKAEAERVLLELGAARALFLMRRKLDSRRDAALARIETVKKDIARDAAADKARLVAWEKRLQAARPLSLKQLGIEWEQPVRVAKYDGRRVVFAGEGFEFTYGLDELPSAVYGEILLLAPDPANARELFDAGKIAARRDAFEAAQKLFARAVKLSPALKAVAPDLDRVRRGIASIRGDVRLSGGALAVRYDFRSAEQAKDFVLSPGTTAFGETLSGTGMFTAAARDLTFSRRGRASFELRSVSGRTGFVGGLELGDDILIALVDPENGNCQVLHGPRTGEPRRLAVADVKAWPSIDISCASPKVEVRVGATVVWSGDLAFDTFSPVYGGNVFGGGDGSATFRGLAIEGRPTASRLQRLRAERSAILEAELAKEARVTREEREAAQLVSGHSFGERPLEPIPLEAELAAVQPKRVTECLGRARELLKRLATVKEPAAWSSIAGLAQEQLSVAVQEAPWYPLTWYGRAEWRHWLGDTVGALSDLEEAAKRAPAFVEARLARATLLAEAHRGAEAARELDAAIEAAPDLARARMSRAMLHYYDGRADAAVAELDLAVRLEPSNLALRRVAKRLRSAIAGPLWSESATVDTKHYTLKAEAPKMGKKGTGAKAAKERLEKLAAHLEAARAYFPTVAPGKPAPVMKPVVYLFATAEGYYVYADFTQEDRMEHTAGCFLPAYRQMLFFEEESETGVLETMTHEAFHEYLDTIAPHAPAWLNEGMAEYVAGIDVSGGRVVATGRPVKGRLWALRAAMEGGWQGIPFEIMLRESREQFYAVMPQLQYAQAWSLVHFLRHGGHEALLERYVRMLADGRTAADAHAATFGKADLAGMRAEWLAYVKSMR